MDGGIRTFEFVTHALLGLRRPLVHAGVTQLAQFLDEPLLHFIGGLQWTVRSARKFQDALEARLQFGMLSQPLHELSFRHVELVTADHFMLHPDLIEESG